MQVLITGIEVIALFAGIERGRRLTRSRAAGRPITFYEHPTR
jgi:hypothetical protein